ncbi:MAG TPA: hypothetical protein VMU61_11815 [Candidatus Aquilonibacter sp.]|nr:hypothetical protein [Candidatus Aquilonibacter sp.]
MKKMAAMIFLLFSSSVIFAAQTVTHSGTIVRMRMETCMGAQHGFMAAMSGAGHIQTGELCPEYVLVTDKVVYVIQGKKSNELVPLADVTHFRLQNNEMLIRIDDARRESHFRVMEMMLRPEWEHSQLIQEEEAGELPRHHPDAAALMNVQ